MTPPTGTGLTFRRAARDTPDINLMPLIDVLFTVLLFLTLTTTLRDTFVFDMELPQATMAGRAGAVAAEVVRIAADDRVFLGAGAVTLDRIGEEMARWAESGAVAVHIVADARATHGRVVAVLDRARAAGIADLRIETTTPP